MSSKSDEELAWSIQNEELKLQQKQQQFIDRDHTSDKNRPGGRSSKGEGSSGERARSYDVVDDDELHDVMLALRLQHEEELAVAAAAAAAVAPPKTSPGKGRVSRDSKAVNPPGAARTPSGSKAGDPKQLDDRSSWSALLNPLSYLQQQDYSRSERCSRCDATLTGRYLRLPSGQMFHYECFVCAGCNLPINGKYIVRDDLSRDMNGSSTRFAAYFHEGCAEALFAQHCRVCNKAFRGGEQFLRHPYFADKGGHCHIHETDGSPSCCSCNLKGQRSDPPVKLPDGRHICNDCIACAIFESNEAIPIYNEILEFFENDLKLSVPSSMRSVPVLVVDLPSLNDQQRLNNFKNMHGGASLVRGLTLSTAETSIRYTVPAHHVSSADYFRSKPGGFDHSLSNPHSVIYNINGPGSPVRRECVTCRSVTAVLVLCGLPRHLAASILAHEAMHVWCKLSTMEMPLDLPPHVEEGLCQLVSWRYLEYVKSQELRKGAAARWSSSWEGRLVSYYQYLIEVDRSPDYGEGFRRAAGAAAAIGLDELLQFVHGAKALPNV